MERNSFGRELEKKSEFGTTLEGFKDFVLYHLDYFFKLKSNEQSTKIQIPFLGEYVFLEKINFNDLIDIPQLYFDEAGCIYSNGEEAVYVSPEYVAKCFIERIIRTYESLYSLYYPRIVLNESKEENHMEDLSLPNVDFVMIYNELVQTRRDNLKRTKGLVGLGPGYENSTAIINLRKLEYGAQIQEELEEALQYAFRKLGEKDYGEEVFYEEDIPQYIIDEISSKVFPMKVIEKYVIDYFKMKIYLFDYQKRVGAKGNPYIDKLGLDVMPYYGHPADKYIFAKQRNWPDDYHLEECIPEDYDDLYINPKSFWFGEVKLKDQYGNDFEGIQL